MRHQLIGVEKLPGEHGFLLVFVGVERRDALLRGAVFLIGQPLLLQRVQVPVPGQQQAGAFTDFQILRRQCDALCGDILHLLPQVLRIQRHTVAEDVDDAVAENAGGQQVQGKLPLFVDDGVAGVAAALIAHDDVIVLRQQVHHPPLALVAPVDPDDRTVLHLFVLLYFPLSP